MGYKEATIALGCLSGVFLIVLIAVLVAWLNAAPCPASRPAALASLGDSVILFTNARDEPHLAE